MSVSISREGKPVLEKVKTLTEIPQPSCVQSFNPKSTIGTFVHLTLIPEPVMSAWLAVGNVCCLFLSLIRVNQAKS